MPRSYDIPRDFSPDNPERLREQLRRLSTALSEFIIDAGKTYLPRFRVSPIYTRGDVSAEYEQFVRIAPQKADDKVSVFLPRPNSADAGRWLLIRREEDPIQGSVIIYSTGGALQNGTNTQIDVTNGSTMFWIFDGTNWACSLADSY